MAFSAYDAATHAIGRSRGLLIGARRTGKRVRRDPKTGQQLILPAHLPDTVRGDMRRLSLVMAVAALDTYMHRLIVERVYTHEVLPGGLAGLEVGFEKLLAQADATKAAAQQKSHNPRPRVEIKKLLRERLLRETFQNADAVGKALAMAGRRKAWPAIAAQLSPPREAAEVKDRLDEIVRRRNQIVHEGDYLRKERPRGPQRNGITQREAENDIEFIEEVIDAIHAVVS